MKTLFVNISCHGAHKVELNHTLTKGKTVFCIELNRLVRKLEKRRKKKAKRGFRSKPRVISTPSELQPPSNFVEWAVTLQDQLQNLIVLVQDVQDIDSCIYVYMYIINCKICVQCVPVLHVYTLHAFTLQLVCTVCSVIVQCINFSKLVRSVHGSQHCKGHRNL